MRLSPNDPQAFRMHAAIASAHFMAGRYREALAWAGNALRFKPNDALATTVVAASSALLDQLDDASWGHGTLAGNSYLRCGSPN